MLGKLKLTTQGQGAHDTFWETSTNFSNMGLINTIWELVEFKISLKDCIKWMEEWIQLKNE